MKAGIFSRRTGLDKSRLPFKIVLSLLRCSILGREILSHKKQKRAPTDQTGIVFFGSDEPLVRAPT